MSKLQELRRNVGFSLSNQNNLKEWIESIETAFPDKEYMQIMKESIMANNDLSTLILNNRTKNFTLKLHFIKKVEQVTKSTFRLQGLYGEREKEEMDSSIIFHSKYKYEMEESNSLMPLSANKQDSIGWKNGFLILIK